MTHFYWCRADDEPDMTDGQKEEFGPIFEQILGLPPALRLTALASLAVTVGMLEADPLQWGQDFVARFGRSLGSAQRGKRH